MIRTLPVKAIADEIQQAYDSSSVLIITGDPGSGKSTQIPQIIWDHNPQPIIITQPRRLAAIEMAKRVSYEMKGGAQVDYTVRFEDTATEKTQVHFVTDGVLLRLMLENQLYGRYATIIIDEVHERTIFIDLILFLIK
jgi:HrpA-like RNA helicase